MMKALGVVFSARKEGNCLRLTAHCLEQLGRHGYETGIINAYESEIIPCSHCGYECFAADGCPIMDDVEAIYRRCEAADVLIFAIPTYAGHLASLYLAFSERVGVFQRSSMESTAKFMKKVNFLIIGNLSAGGDMALHEALYDFMYLAIPPEALLFPAREYGRTSIDGDLIELPEVKERLNGFVKRVLNKSRSDG